MLQADAKMGRLNIITTIEMQTMTVSTKNSFLVVDLYWNGEAAHEKNAQDTH
jgi:hypothetical protein